MAITFTSGTVTEASAAAAGAALQVLLRDTIDAKAGYSLVEEFTPGGGAINWVVMKLDSATSGLSTDLYFVIARTIATGAVQVGVGEAYNAGTHTISKYAPFIGTGVSNLAAAADRTYAGTFVLSTTAPAVTLGVLELNGGIPATTSKWSLCIDNDHMIIAFQTISTVVAVYAGCITSLVHTPATNDPVPAVNADLTTANTTNSGTSTRHPLITTGVAVTYNFGIAGSDIGSGNNIENWVVAGAAGAVGYNLIDLFMGVPKASRLVCLQAVGGTPATQGRVRGLYKHLVYLAQPPGGVVFGDTFGVDGNIHSVIRTNPLTLVDTGVAV